MATSGTIGSTVIDTAKVLDHAVRRCGLSPSTITPEQIDIALENLYLVLQSLYNRGINLWCVDRQLIGLNPNKNRYDLPAGTVDVMSARFRYGFQLAVKTESKLADRYTAEFPAAIAIKTVGIYFKSSLFYNLVVEVSNDGTTWSATKYIPQFAGLAGNWYWFDIDPAYAVPFIRVRETLLNTDITPIQFDTVVMMNSVTSVPVEKMSRDTYDALNNKTIPGRPLQFLFDKLVNPQIVLWPTPTDSYTHIEITRQRQVQDVGALQDQLEIPQRWYEAMIWQLSSRLCYELSGVDKDRTTLVLGMAASTLKEAEDGETDGSPIFIRPNIAPYTR